MRIKPTFNNVVLTHGEDHSSNGKNRIVLPNHLEEERKGWIVFDVGPDVTCCKKGDQVAFNSATGAAKMELDGQSYVVMPDKDIVGIIVK